MGSVLRNLVGATWYLLVATFGLVAVCVAATSRETLARLLRRDFGTAELCLGLLLGLLVLSSLWFVDATRPDQLVYGRYPAGWTSPQPVVEAHGAAVAYDTAHFDGKAVKVVQWFLRHTHFETFDSAAQPPPATLVFSGAAWFKEHPQRPATILWRDPGRDQVLWKLGPEP